MNENRLEKGKMSSFFSIKAVLFDCDGTLVDSEGAHFLAWQKTLEAKGVHLSAKQELQFTGMSDLFIAKSFVDSLGCRELDLLREKSLHYSHLHEQGLPPIEPTVRFLKQLGAAKKELGLKLGVASAAAKEEVLSHLKHLEVEAFLDVILSGHDDLKGLYFDPEGINKPKPYIYLHAAKLLDVLPSECVVIEDSITGVMSAKAAGCFTIAIPNLLTKEHDLSAADMKIDSLSGINGFDFLKEIAH